MQGGEAFRRTHASFGPIRCPHPSGFSPFTVGLVGLEPTTSSLSGMRSNQSELQAPKEPRHDLHPGPGQAYASLEQAVNVGSDLRILAPGRSGRQCRSLSVTSTPPITSEMRLYRNAMNTL